MSKGKGGENMRSKLKVGEKGEVVIGDEFLEELA